MAKKLIGATPVFGPDVPDLDTDGKQKTGPGGKSLMKRGEPVMELTGLQKMKGGREFDFCLMPASVSLGIQVDAAHVIGPSIIKAIEISGASEADQAAALPAIIGDFTKALTTLPPGKALEIARTLFHYVYVEDGPEGRRETEIDVDFTGKPKMMWLVIAEALKANLGDFFPGSL